MEVEDVNSLIVLRLISIVFTIHFSSYDSVTVPATWNIYTRGINTPTRPGWFSNPLWRGG